MSDIKYTVFTYGGGEQLGLVFNAIAALFKHNAYEYAFYISAIIFAFWVLVTSVVKNQLLVPIKWIFWFWIATTLMLAPKTNIMISDPITNYERKVDNVPYVLGAFAGMISSMGHGMTEVVEMFFKAPDYQKYGETGSVFASKILKNMGKYRIRDGVLKENMERFIHQCVKLEALMGGKYTLRDLHHTNNIWELVKNNANPINGFSYRDISTKKTTILTCKEGAPKLDKDLEKHTKSLASYFGKRYRLSSDKTTSDTVFAGLFKEKIKNSYSYMSGIAESAEDLLKQEMMINAIEDVKRNYAVSKATIQQREWHLITGELASHFLVSMKIVLETLAYSGFIFIAIMVMLPTGVTILGQYFGILMWLQLWAPLYAVLNMVMSSVASHQTQGMLGGEGVSMLTSSGLAGLHADIEAIAAMCSASIPFLSYALLKGGVGSFMHLAGTMTGAMSGSAQVAASEVTSGNVSMNNVGYGGRQQLITTAFKHDTGLNYKSGRMDMERMDGSQGFMTAGGHSGVIAGAGINTSKLADQFTRQKNTTAGMSNLLHSETSAIINEGRNYDKAMTIASSQSKELLQSMSKNLGQTRGWQISEGSKYADSINKTAAFTKQLQENEGYTAAQAAEITGSIGLGGKALGFGGSSSFTSKAAHDKAMQHGKQLAETQGLTHHLESGVSHLDDVKYNEVMGEEKRGEEGRCM